MKKIFFLSALVISTYLTQAQVIFNSDLNGPTVFLMLSTLPYGWQNVPAGDPTCMATTPNASDTPDLTIINGPIGGLISGNPYSGLTFMSGLHAIDQPPYIFQEGIMQTVTGFITNTSYTINFFQSVVKQSNCLDPSGSWSVYIDNTLAGTSAPTYSTTTYGSTSLVWNKRSIVFTATATTHTLKFLPTDDDPNIKTSGADITGGIRMGIDSVWISCNQFTSNQNPTICVGNSFTLPKGQSIDTSGIYTDTLISVGGCDSIITTTLVVIPAVTVNQTPTICSGDNYILPKGNSVTTAGIYYDTLTTSITGCDSIITTTLVVMPAVTVNQTPTICSGSNYTLPKGNNANSTGTYYDTLISGAGCDSIIKTILTVDSIPATISPDITITIGTTTALTATGGFTYNWFPSNGLNTTIGTTVIASPSQTITYCTEVISTIGCKDTVCVTVNVAEAPCAGIEHLVLPNAFSPNNDGVNDEFCLQGLDNCFDYFTITIYNRWGETIYKSNDAKFCWNGSYKGVTLDSQVCIYVIKATFMNQTKPVDKKGSITLTR